LEKWMVTTNGLFSPSPYYLRLTKDGMPNVGTMYDGGSSAIDQRKVADAGFLELVRLGIKPA
jgi:glucoamylase